MIPSRLTIARSEETEALVSAELLAGSSLVPEELAPFAVSLRNVSELPIAAMMVHVETVRVDGVVADGWFLRHNFDNSNQSLAPSMPHLFTPFGMQAERHRELLQESEEWRTLTVRVDSVLDARGRLVGRDTAGCFRMFTEWIRADLDLAGRLLLPDADVAEVLRAAPVDSGGGTFLTKDHFADRWGRYARMFERQLRDRGVDSVLQAAEQLGAAARARFVFREG